MEIYYRFYVMMQILHSPALDNLVPGLKSGQCYAVIRYYDLLEAILNFKNPV